MPSPALSDPRRERARNDEQRGYRPGRDCPVCHVHLGTPRAMGGHAIRPDKVYCGPRCRVFAWRRDGDPDGPLNYAKASKRL